MNQQISQDDFEAIHGVHTVPLHSEPKRFNPISIDDVTLPTEQPALVQGILFSETLAVIYGPPGSGKSFLALDLGVHLAAGIDWAGREAKMGGVIYVSAEGQRGFRKRLVAVRDTMSLPKKTPFYMIADAPNLGSLEGDAEKMIAQINAHCTSKPIALVVLDTLSRVIGSGDENDSVDMGILVANAERIKRELCCAVMLIHHTGKDVGRGARGSSVLKAAVDTEISVENTDGVHLAKVEKQRDAEGGLSLTFKLLKFDLPDDPDGTCTLQVGTWKSKDGSAPSVTGQAALALRALEEALSDHGELPPISSGLSRTKQVVREQFWRDACAKRQITQTDTPAAKQKAFKRSADKLQAIKKIGYYDGFVWIN
jgi:hypothetical protein